MSRDDRRPVVPHGAVERALGEALEALATPSAVNSETARRLLELGMHPRDIAAWLGRRRRRRD